MRRRQAFAKNPKQLAAMSHHLRDPWLEMARKIEGPHIEYKDLSDSMLADSYESVFGKPPHHRMKRETIVERLNDACHDRA